MAEVPPSGAEAVPNAEDGDGNGLQCWVERVVRVRGLSLAVLSPPKP